MTRSECLKTLMLLSALESWILATGKPVPEFLQTQLTECVKLLTKGVME